MHITSLVTIEQKVKLFKERHILRMGAYGDLDTNCHVPLFLSLCEIFGCFAIMNNASFFYKILVVKKKKKVKIYHELDLFMGALGKMINNINV
jgi:hypothetical protein